MMKALIIIDMFFRDVQHRKDKEKLIKNQLKLINAFKEAKQTVILVGGLKSGKPRLQKNPVMLRLWGNEVSKNSKENKLIPELLKAPYDYYLPKHEYSAFYKTNLEKYCKRNRITELYFAGISSGCCVFFSAADAAMRGILPILVSDASGAPDEKTHKKNQKGFKKLLGLVMSTKQVVKMINKVKHNNIFK